MNNSVRVCIVWWEERFPDYELRLLDKSNPFIGESDYFEVSKKFYKRYLKIKKDYDRLQETLEELYDKEEG